MKHRRPPVPHWEKGKGFCRWCGEAVLGRGGAPSDRRWHPACVLAYKLAAWSAEQRRVCWVRDHGVCGVCGRDCAAQERLAIGQRHLDQWLGGRAAEDRFGDWFRQRRDGTEQSARVWLRQELEALRRERGWPKSGESWWQADHIRPLVDGGGLDLAYFAAENLMTLCCACHKAKTAREAAERAARRKAAVQSVPAPGEPLLL